MHSNPSSNGCKTPVNQNSRSCDSIVSFMTIAYTNTDRLTDDKISELKARIPESRLHILAITIVKPKNYGERFKKDYALSGFGCYSCSLASDSDRGFIIDIHENLNHLVLQINVVTTFSEAIFLELRLRGDKLLIGCIYRSPSSSDTNAESLNNLICTLCNSIYSHLCLMGDFNVPNINLGLQTTTELDDSYESHLLQTV